MQQKRLWHERIDEEARMMTDSGPHLRRSGDMVGIRTREFFPVQVLCIEDKYRVKGVFRLYLGLFDRLVKLAPVDRKRPAHY